MRIKVLKIISWLVVLGVLGAGLYYLQLSNRHKAIVKTTLLHTLGMGGGWYVTYEEGRTSYLTPSLFVDNIYTSMEGPKVMQGFQINPNSEDLVWISGYQTQVMAADGITPMANDFMCHTNLDYYDQSYYSKWQLPNRIGVNYPRLATLTNGMESYTYPEGFGFPIKSNEYLYLSTQILNHNIKAPMMGMRHKVNIFHQPDSPAMQPLRPLTVFMMLPYDSDSPFDNEAAKTDPSVCIPVETKNHNYSQADGTQLSGHWVVFPGQWTFTNDITEQLAIKDTVSLHHIATHLHPFAETLSLYDGNTGELIFKARATNLKDRVGLEDITEFSSKEGVMLYPGHNYELKLEVNNTSGKKQDMMASMFLALYDEKLDKVLKSRFAD